MAQFRKNAFIKYTVPSTMLLVICLQFILVRTVHVSPWKGGGFGMFSTVNTPVSHIVRVFSYGDAGKKIPVVIPEKLEQYERGIRHLATEFNINKLKSAMKKETWALKNSSIAVAENIKAGSADSSGAQLVELNKIKVELWRYHFDLTSKKYYSTLIAEF